MRISNSSIVILHGWGLWGDVYQKLADLLEQEGYNVYTPDLPGFGKEPLKNTANMNDYVCFLNDFIKKKKPILPVVVIGHSFGGRVAIKYAFYHPENISKLILTGVPIIRHKTIGKKLAFIGAMVGGKVFNGFPFWAKRFLRKIFYRLIGEWDYYHAGPLKEVFKNIIGEDLVLYVKGIKSPVLLVFGKNDRITPASDVYKIKAVVPSVKYLIIPGFGHKLPYENPRLFFQSIQSFL